MNAYFKTILCVMVGVWLAKAVALVLSQMGGVLP